MGSAWASEFGVSTGLTAAGGSHSDGSSKAGASKAARSNAGTATGNTKTAAGGGSGRAGSEAKSADTGSGGEEGGGGSGRVSSGTGSSPYGTSLQLSSVNWGHEPQYLHNVRKITTNGYGMVSTIAGGIIRKYLFPCEHFVSSNRTVYLCFIFLHCLVL